MARSYQNPRLAGQAFPMLFACGGGGGGGGIKRVVEEEELGVGGGKLDQGGGRGTWSEKSQPTEKTGLKMEWQTLSAFLGFRP